MPMRAFLGVAIAAVVLAVAAYQLRPAAERSLLFEPADTSTFSGRVFDYEGYALTLGRHVDDEGGVDYDALKEDPSLLHGFAADLARLARSEYGSWSEPEQIAFWINAYNALTLEAILAHYPIEASLWTALMHPKESIRQIPGVWDKLRFRVMGETMTLDDIEHRVLRRQFQEPRIHVALVCASVGCPPLRNEPYSGGSLDAQLEDQGKRFLSLPRNFRIDRANRRVGLSSIFQWYGQDFVPVYGVAEGFPGRSPVERAVLSYSLPHIEERDRVFLRNETYAIEYLDYDWSLNKRPRSKQVTEGSENSE